MKSKPKAEEVHSKTVKKNTKREPKIGFRVSESDRQKAEYLAKTVGMNMSDFARSKIFDGLEESWATEQVLVNLVNQQRQTNRVLNLISSGSETESAKLADVSVELKNTFHTLCEYIAKQS
jgi:CelD/BcsL family acetyltransferase involved in cellulose biosynthesis